MTDMNKTKKQLVTELAKAHRQIKELEKSGSKHKQAEEALQKSEEKYRTLVTSIPVVTWITDNKGNTSFISPNIKEVYGFSSEEVCSAGDSLWFGRIHPDDIKQVIEAYEGLFKREGMFDIEYRIQRKDGQWIYLHDKAIATYKEEGVMYGYGVFEDITEQKQAEEALKETTSFIDKIIESSAVSMWISDEKGTAIRANPACLEFFGATEEEVIGKYNLFQDTVIEKQGFMPDIRKVFEKGEAANIIIDYDFGAVDHVDVKKATHKIVNSIFTPILESDGKVSNVIAQAIDLTDIMKAKDELQESQHFIESVFESIQDGISVLTPDLTIRHVNNLMKEWYPKNLPLEGKKCYEVYQNRNRPCDPCPTLRCMKSGKTERDIVSGLSGSAVEWIELFSYPMKDQKTGKINGAVEFARNITEQKQAEEALRKSEGKYHLLTESSQDGIYIIGTEGFEYVNPAFKKILGYKTKEIFSKDFNFFDTIHPDDKKLIEERKEAREKGEKLPSIYSFRIITKSGKTKHVEVNTVPLPGEGTHILGILRDSTEQKQAEEALQASEQKYRSIFKNTGTATAIIEADMSMSLVNSEMEKLTGYSKKEIEGKKKWLEFVVKEDLAIMKKYHLSRRKGGDESPKRYEARVINRAGEVRQGLLIVDMIPGTEQSVTSVLDITDHKQADEKIKASLKEKEVLLQEVHHRVKNNMQIIVSLLRLQSYAAKDKKIEDMFKVAQSRIRSMAIIHEKLYKSKDFANIDFSQYIRSLTSHLMQTYQIDPKQISLKTDVKDVYLDINQGVPVGLLINELVSNALKHAFPKGKKGEISLKFYADKKGKKTLIVSDNGIGHADKVDVSKPETLGMQLIKDLTRQIGGKLDLENKAGTTFKITFS